MRNFCTKCGARISSKYSYCGNCGAPLSDGLSPEVLSSVMVRELESGDVVYYRPPVSQSVQPAPPLSGQIPDAEDESTDVETQNDLPVVEVPLYELQEEAAPITEAPEISIPTDMDELFTSLPLMEKFSFPETDVESENFDEKAQNTPSDASEEPIANLEMFFSQDTRQDFPKTSPVSRTEPDNELDEHVRRFLNDEPLSQPNTDSISLMGWVGIIFLLMIPGVNLLLIIIWALGGCRKKQKARFARALLIAIVIIALLVIASQALLKDYIYTAISNILRSKAVSEFALKLLGCFVETAENWGLDMQSLFPPS